MIHVKLLLDFISVLRVGIAREENLFAVRFRSGRGSHPPATAAFHPLVNSPFLRLACTSSSSSRRRLDSPLRALLAGPHLAAGWGAPRARRVVAAFAGEESVPFLLGGFPELHGYWKYIFNSFWFCSWLCPVGSGHLKFEISKNRSSSSSSSAEMPSWWDHYLSLLHHAHLSVGQDYSHGAAAVDDNEYSQWQIQAHRRAGVIPARGNR
ncbi:hypothetical protein ABZP36_000504 [Zizania latifolia]